MWLVVRISLMLMNVLTNENSLWQSILIGGICFNIMRFVDSG